jgi:hypothetical protein
MGEKKSAMDESSATSSYLFLSCAGYPPHRPSPSFYCFSLYLHFLSLSFLFFFLLFPLPPLSLSLFFSFCFVLIRSGRAKNKRGQPVRRGSHVPPGLRRVHWRCEQLQRVPLVDGAGLSDGTAVQHLQDCLHGGVDQHQHAGAVRPGRGAMGAASCGHDGAEDQGHRGPLPARGWRGGRVLPGRGPISF